MCAERSNSWSFFCEGNSGYSLGPLLLKAASFLSNPEEMAGEHNVNTKQLFLLSALEWDLLQEVNPHLLKLNYRTLIATWKEEGLEISAFSFTANT